MPYRNHYYTTLINYDLSTSQYKFFPSSNYKDNSTPMDFIHIFYTHTHTHIYIYIYIYIWGRLSIGNARKKEVKETKEKA